MTKMTTTPPSHQLRARVEAALVRGETQTSLSIASGVTRSKISDWLAGKCTMTLGTADRLWAACENPPAQNSGG